MTGSDLLWALTILAALIAAISLARTRDERIRHTDIDVTTDDEEDR